MEKHIYGREFDKARQKLDNLIAELGRMTVIDKREAPPACHVSEDRY